MLAGKPRRIRGGRAKGVAGDGGPAAAARGREDAQTGGARPEASAGPADLLPRVECLEQDHQCLRWLIGAALAPLALIAILA